MSERTSRRGLFDFARRIARGSEGEAGPEVSAEAEAGAPEAGVPAEAAEPMIATVSSAESDAAEPEPMAPWARRAAAAAAPKPASVARVLAFACIGGSPSFCSTCVEHCPIEGALELTARAPRVNAELCDGCGICERVCPAPQRAIVVLPRLPSGGGPR